MELIKKQLTEAQINAIIAKCWEDKTFKQQLITNPVQIIKKMTGYNLDIPENVQLVINDQTDTNYAYFNIPPKPNYEDVELSDKELDIIAGGGTDFPIG